MMKDMTREETISLHRKMWGWIADRIEETREVQDIHYLKRRYLNNRGEQAAKHCYCCEYAEKRRVMGPATRDNSCFYCPLDWENPDVPRCPCELYSDEEEPVFDIWDGAYGKCRKLFDNKELCAEYRWMEQAEYPRLVANIKEKEELV